MNKQQSPRPPAVWDRAQYNTDKFRPPYVAGDIYVFSNETQLHFFIVGDHHAEMSICVLDRDGVVL